MNTQKIHIVIGLGMRPYTIIVEKIHKVGACFILHYPASWGRTLRDAVALGFRCNERWGRVGAALLSLQ